VLKINVPMSLKKIRQYLLVAIIALLFLGIGFRLGERNSGRVSVTTGQNVAGVDTSVMNEVLDRLKQSYLKPEDINSKKLMYGAAEGMTSSLGDPYTSFYPPVENVRSKEDLQGEFGGVGIQLGYIDDTLAVMAPLKGTPAEKAGIKAGDLILRIKDDVKKIDKDTSELKIDEAVDLIRGIKGTTVILTIFHDGENQSRDVSLVRDTINVPSTEIEWVDNGRVAVLRVNKFGEQTLGEWNKMVDQVIAQKAMGVILDLRNNPGGFLQRAVDLGSEFIPDGVIVKQRDRNTTETLNVDRRGRLIGMPLVVLINKGSASASEILAGALRERIGIKLVGEKSFGKGTVQEVQDLSGGAGLHITIAEWLLPSGKNIHKEGLTPDVEIKYELDPKNPEVDNQMDKALEVLKGLGK